MKRAGRTLVAIALIAVLLGAMGSAGVTRAARTSGTVVDTSSSLTVTATNSFSFSPNVVDQLPVNTSISLHFINGDSTGGVHTFTIIGCANVTIPRSGPNAYNFAAFINGSKCSQPPLDNVAPPSYGQKTVSFSAPTKPGWFEFVCTTPGHMSLGMYGFIAFGTVVPANITPASGTPGAGAAVFIIVGTIVTLTVVAIVLGFVVGRREGAKFEMPPERLGYAEPPSGSPPTRP